jgi:hypothetical protein
MFNMPSRLWVKMRNTHREQMFSALPPKAVSSRTSRYDRFVPNAEVKGFLARSFQYREAEGAEDENKSLCR